MSGAEAVAEQTEDTAPAKPAWQRRKLLLIAVPAAVVALGAGGWFSGLVPRVIGLVVGTGPAKPDRRASSTCLK